jgi:acetyl esterase/lipase
MVAIAVDYRLSTGNVTPIDALSDVCAAFDWVRKKKNELGVRGKVAGYGVSAGAHLVALSATLGCGSSSSQGPDALVLSSPALDVARDQWFGKLLQGRGTAPEYSPVEHVNKSTPPTCIVHGREDTLTPLSGSQKFCEKLTGLGGVCELNVYDGVGHLLTRNLANQEDDFDPDPVKRADGIEKQRLFLVKLGLIKGTK